MKLRRRCKCGCGGITTPGRKWLWGHRNKFLPGENHPKYKHGLTNDKLYTVWKHMKARCYSPNGKQYQDWGGRGIRVYIRWRNNFKVFYNWAIANGWKEGLTIDRIDNDGNYHPDNCRFVTRAENNKNQRPQKMPNTNTTGYVGVCFRKDRNKYIARPWIDGKPGYLGSFNTAEEAAMAIEEYKGD